jgi:glycosyltransferase involved in cell wall biosynthesis
MKIAQVAPLWESVPPQCYGGTERIVSYLTEELVRLGHDVTLFATADSVTAAKLEAIYPTALRLAKGLNCKEAPIFLELERAFGVKAREFDLIHSHVDITGFPFARRCSTPVLTTLHGRLDLPELLPMFQEFPEMPVISISNAQRRPVGWLNWQETVYHGLPADLYSFHAQPGKYLAFLGRISPEKRPDHAIALAKHVGMPLRIAAKVDPVDRAYFETQIEPLLDHPLVEYVGEITDEEKNDFLGDAYALVCPYDWPEPFGIVLIEALACGTPVLAYNRGSIPEVIEHGRTGIVCEDLSQMMTALESVTRIDRAHCRENFERRFTVQRMVQDYLKVYERQLEGKTLLPNSTTLDQAVDTVGVHGALGMRTEELRTEELVIRNEEFQVPN